MDLPPYRSGPPDILGVVMWLKRSIPPALLRTIPGPTPQPSRCSVVTCSYPELPEKNAKGVRRSSQAPRSPPIDPN
jgi:hypothetical protein